MSESLDPNGPEVAARRAFRAHKDEACRYADAQTRGFFRCTCGWENGDHEDRCELQREWDRAYYMRLDELEEDTDDESDARDAVSFHEDFHAD